MIVAAYVAELEDGNVLFVQKNDDGSTTVTEVSAKSPETQDFTGNLVLEERHSLTLMHSKKTHVKPRRLVMQWTNIVRRHQMHPAEKVLPRRGDGIKLIVDNTHFPRPERPVRSAPEGELRLHLAEE